MTPSILRTSECENYCTINSCHHKLVEQCDDASWINYKDKCIKIIDESLTWEESKLYCDTFNASLIKIKERNYQNYISKLADLKIIKKNYYFIGLYRKNLSFLANILNPANNEWSWTDGSDLNVRKSDEISFLF